MWSRARWPSATQRHRWSAEKRRPELYPILLQWRGRCGDRRAKLHAAIMRNSVTHTDGNSDSNRLAQRLLRPGAWATATPGPPLRYRAGGCTDGTYIYVFGGGDDVGGSYNDLWRGTRRPRLGHNWLTCRQANRTSRVPTGTARYTFRAALHGVHITENAIYDIATNTWSTGAPLPAIQTGTNVAFNNKIYNFGGNPGPQATSRSTTSPPTPGPPARPCPWPSPMGDPRWPATLLICGGHRGRHEPTVYRYDFAANSWATMAPLQTARTSEELMTSPDGCKLYAVMGGDATFFTGVP